MLQFLKGLTTNRYLSATSTPSYQFLVNLQRKALVSRRSSVYQQCFDLFRNIQRIACSSSLSACPGRVLVGSSRAPCYIDLELSTTEQITEKHTESEDTVPTGILSEEHQALKVQTS